MKTKITICAGLVTLATSSLAFADESTAAKRDRALPSTATSAPVTPAAATPAPGAPTTAGTAAPGDATSTSTTTTTSADGDATATPMPAAAPPPGERETVTLYQSVRPNKPYLYTGGIMFLGAYATTATLTAVSDNANADKNLYLPVVGPWVHLADSAATRSNSTTDTILIAGSGVVQGVGAGLMLASLFIPEKVPAATIQAGNTKVHFAPTSFGIGSAGAAAGGTF